MPRDATGPHARSMNPRTRRLAVAAVVPSAALLALTGVALTSGSSSAADGGARTLRLTYQDAHFAFNDVAPLQGTSGAPTMGDTFYIGDTLLQSGAKVGYADLVCTITRPGKQNSRSAHSQCEATLELKHGTITASGIVPLADTTQYYAITGGTGAYRSASGVVEEAGHGHVLTVTLDR
jgi:hypothetical protein